MKKIGINIDGIIRDSYSKFDEQYRKVFIHNPSLVAMNEGDMTVREFTEEELDEIDKMIEVKTSDMISLPIDSADLLNHYKFEEKEIPMTADSFLIHDGEVYENAAQEAIKITSEEALHNFMFEDYALQIFGQAEEIGRAMDTVNRIQSMGLDNGSFEIILLTTCKKKAVPATYSFLALKNCRINKLVFVEEDYQKWDYCDILIDTMPESLQAKPKGKISVKINKDFNKWDEADYSFDNIQQVYNKEFLKSLS